MGAACQDCGHKFLIDAQHVVEGPSCGACGSRRLERDQPSPTHSDGELRNMVDPISQADQGGNPLAEGTIMGSDGERPLRKRDNFMHAKTASGDFDFSDDAPQETHKFVVTHGGGVHSLPADSFHEDIANLHDLHHQGYPNNMSLGVLHDNGEAQFLQHESPHDSATLARLVGTHFNHPVSINPTLRPTSSDERWIGDSRPGVQGEQTLPNYLQRKQQELQAVQDRGRPFPHYENPYFNRGGSHHDRASNMEPYLPWTHEADVQTDRPEVEDLSPTSASVRPAGRGGIHSGPLEYLGFLNARINGLSARDQAKDIYATRGVRSHPDFGQHVHVEVDHPSHLPAAIETVRMGLSGPSPEMKRTGRAIQAGELPAPPPFRGKVLGPTPLEGYREANIKTAGPAALLAPLAEVAAPALMGGVLRGVGSHIIGDALGGSPVSPGAPPAQETMGPQAPTMASRTADLETPSSVPFIGISGDPEKVDQREFNDGSDSTNFVNPELGDIGGSDLGEDAVAQNAGFAHNSPGIQRMNLLAPLLLHYHNSPDSGATDPLVKELHNILEEENPGYLKKADEHSHKALKKVLKSIGAKTADVVPTPQVQNQPIVPQNPGAPVNPNGQGRCPFCGGIQTADGSCPQCGAKAGSPNAPGAIPQAHPPAHPAAPVGQPVPASGYQGYMASTVLSDDSGVDVNQQGPKTPEQVSAVQEFLIHHNRIKEVPLVPLNPADYADELATVAQKTTQPVNVKDPAPPAPEPPVEDADPSAGMPVPAPPTGPQPMSSVTAADNVAPRCPHCHSATTGLLNDKNCQCHACHNIWTQDDLVKSAAPAPGVSADQQDAQRDLGQEQDSSQSWQDDSGNALQTGQEYEMVNPKYKIPDLVRIDAIKPSSLTVTTLGEYDNQGGGLQYKHEIAKEDVDLEQITFHPADASDADPNQVDDTPKANTEPVHQSVERMTSTQECPSCGEGQGITSSMSSPTTNMHDCLKCGNAWETKISDVSSEDNLDARAWIHEDGNFMEDLGRSEAMRAASDSSRNIASIARQDPRNEAVHNLLETNKRTAGKKFSPSEQRAFIDEQGIARNADLLDLEGTHYKIREVGTSVHGRPADGSRVRDEDLIFGI